MALLLSYSTWGMPTVPIETAVAHCARLGFDGLELTVIPGWSTDAATLDAAARRRIRALYDQHEVELCGVTGNTPLLAADRDEHARNTAPALRVHFDVSHFNVQGMDMDTVIAQLAPHSVHTHLKDERGVAPDFEFLIPGEGECDYMRYLKGMERAGYDGHVTVEISIMVQR